MFEYGVFIGKDIEVVITEKYMMTFRKLSEANALESCLLKKETNLAKYHCIGICRSTPIFTEMNSRPKQWKYAFWGREKVYSNNVKLADCLGKSIVDTKEVKNRVEFLFWDSGVFPANLDESFSMAGIHPHSPTISDNNIGECLNCWNMGCYEEIIETKTKDIFVSVTINTLKHMYHFQMLPNDFYCRAARYKTCNAGVVFNQNFRQRKSDSPETYMVEDNHVSACPLPIDENNFYFNSCPVIDYNQLMEKYLNKREQKVLCYRYGINGSRKMTQKEIASQLGISRSYVSQIQKKARETVESFIPKPADNSIYWSVSSYTDNQILLNGCQGDTYQWNKPDR